MPIEPWTKKKKEESSQLKTKNGYGCEIIATKRRQRRQKERTHISSALFVRKTERKKKREKKVNRAIYGTQKRKIACRPWWTKKRKEKKKKGKSRTIYLFRSFPLRNEGKEKKKTRTNHIGCQTRARKRREEGKKGGERESLSFRKRREHGKKGKKKENSYRPMNLRTGNGSHHGKKKKRGPVK